MSKYLVILSLLGGITIGGIYLLFPDPVKELRYYRSFQQDLEIRHQEFMIKLPDDMSFAGEKVHFRTPSSYFRFEKELKHNTQNNSSTRYLLRNVRIWLPEIERILAKHGVPDDFKYLAVAESNLSHAVSEKNAVGFWQFTKATGEELGLEINDEVDERYNPMRSTEAACKYFKKAHKVFDNWTLSAAAYNRGINGILRAIDDQKANDFYDLDLNDETAAYIYRILAMKDLIAHPQKYKMRWVRSDRSYFKTIKVDTTINNLIKFCKKNNLAYLTIKEYNPWILKNTLTIKTPGHVYYLLVPVNEQGNKYVVQLDTNRSPLPKEKDVLPKVPDETEKDSLEAAYPVISDNVIF